MYDALEEDAKDDINIFEDGIISKETNKESCEEDSCTWVDGEYDLDEEQLLIKQFFIVIDFTSDTIF